MKPPCLKCDQVGCGNHANCEKYQAYDAERQVIRETKQKEYILNGYVTEEVHKSKQSSRRYRNR